MSRPKHKAYSTEQVTDGLVVWEQWNFDFDKGMTEADWKELQKRLDAGSFHDRIDWLAGKLASLPADSDAAIKMHAGAIQQVLDGLRGLRANEVTKPLFDSLQDAEERWAKIVLLRDLVPAARKGRKFPPGRKPGARGPVGKAIRAALQSDPTLTNADLWERIKARPPRGWRAFESTRLGKYFEGPTAADTTSYARFRNIAAEERKGLKSA